MEKEQQQEAEEDPSPFTPPPPTKPSHKKEPHQMAFSPTEDTFIDTANLVKEDSDV